MSARPGRTKWVISRSHCLLHRAAAAATNQVLKRGFGQQSGEAAATVAISGFSDREKERVENVCGREEEEIWSQFSGNTFHKFCTGQIVKLHKNLRWYQKPKSHICFDLCLLWNLISDVEKPRCRLGSVSWSPFDFYEQHFMIKESAGWPWRRMRTNFGE